MRVISSGWVDGRKKSSFWVADVWGLIEWQAILREGIKDLSGLLVRMKKLAMMLLG